MAYWNKVVSGRRFFLWFDVAAASIVIALLQLQLQLRGGNTSSSPSSRAWGWQRCCSFAGSLGRDGRGR